MPSARLRQDLNPRNQREFLQNHLTNTRDILDNAADLFRLAGHINLALDGYRSVLRRNLKLQVAAYRNSSLS